MYPEKRIVVAKIDLKLACRRTQLFRLLVAMVMTIVGSFALIPLLLPFYGAYCLHWLCIISDFICNVTNALLRYEF